MIRLAWPDVGAEEAEAVAEVLASGRLTMGPKVAEFEAEIARACATKHAVAVSSGTAALHLAAAALEPTADGEVIVPAYTFPATANAVVLAGARPVLVDVDPDTMNLDADRVAEAVTPKTRAVVAVHLFGRPVDWAALGEVVPSDVHIVEDAAGALGARWQGKPCGGLGTLGCLSFHPRKIVTTGEGGAVACDDDGLARSIRRLRHHGISSDDGFDIPEPGLNYRLSDLQCAVGLVQIRRLERLLGARERLAEAYRERLERLVETPSAAAGDRHGWQAYVVKLDRRDEALEGLRADGIEAQIGTYALHHLTAYRDQGQFPGADACFRRALALPFHSKLTESDVDRVVETIRRYV